LSTARDSSRCIGFGYKQNLSSCLLNNITLSLILWDSTWTMFHCLDFVNSSEQGCCQCCEIAEMTSFTPTSKQTSTSRVPIDRYPFCPHGRLHMAVGVILPVLLTSISLLARAHEHHAQLGDDEKDAPVDLILWIHIVVQATVWGVLFPIGMVLGITRSRWHVPLQASSFHGIQVAGLICTCIAVHGVCPYGYWVFIGTRTPWAPIFTWCSRFLCVPPIDTNGRAIHTGSLSETSHTREIAQTDNCPNARLVGKVISIACMGSDVVRRNHPWTVLSHVRARHPVLRSLCYGLLSA